MVDGISQRIEIRPFGKLFEKKEATGTHSRKTERVVEAAEKGILETQREKRYLLQKNKRWEDKGTLEKLLRKSKTKEQ